MGKTTAVANPAETAVSTNVLDPTTFEADQGQGSANMGADDIALPYLTILQQLSPQLGRSNPKYIEEAEEGDILNTVSEELFSSKDGIYVIPCAYQKAWVEWMPRDSGGGWVAAHYDASILQQTTRDDRGFDVLPNKNVIIPTAYYFCLLTDKDQKRAEPVILSLFRTQLKKSRRWNSAITGIRMEGKNGPFNPPMFSHVYHLTTLPESKKGYNWMGWDINVYEQVKDARLYNSAKKLSAEVSKGLVKAGKMEDDVSGTGKADEEDIPF